MGSIRLKIELPIHKGFRAQHFTFYLTALLKQIAARVKLTGAQWEEQNVQQVLKQRCAYLNGQFSTATYAAG